MAVDAPETAEALDARAVIEDAIATLYPWQRRFFMDDEDVQVVCWARQMGKDFGAAAKATAQALADGGTWYIVSLTQRQADATFEKCKWWAKRWQVAFEEIAEQFTEHDPAADEAFTYNARELRMPNGGRVVSLPGKNPDTLAGFSGNVILTEFGLFPGGGYDHWRVIFPLTTKGFRVVVISTPRGRDSRFFELVNDPQTYSVHRANIIDAVAEGFELTNAKGEPVDLDTFREKYGDESGWRREYLCEFSGDLEALVSWAKLSLAGERGRGEPFELLEVAGEAGWRPGFFGGVFAGVERGRLEIGWDIARKSDLSVVWVNHAVGTDPKRLACLVVMRGVEFALQREIVCSVMDVDLPSVGAGDATGLGMDSNETLRNVYGDRWLPYTFSAKSKSELGSLLATTYGDGGQTLPPAEGATKFIAADVYAIQREDVGSGDSRRLKLTENENPLRPESHCDIAYANALALRAAALSHATPRLSFL